VRHDADRRHSELARLVEGGQVIGLRVVDGLFDVVVRARFGQVEKQKAKGRPTLGAKDDR